MIWAITLTAGLLVTLYILLRKTSAMKKLEEAFRELNSKFKSVLVRHGQTWQKFAPFMENFDKIANRENAVFMGMPLDLVVFDEEAIKFIEIKTGNSKLSDKQQHIKNLILAKKVEWHELREGS